MRLLARLSALRAASPARRGSALLMSFLILLVLVAIMAQLKFATHTEMRVTENDVALTAMDLAIESALLEVYEQLKADGEAGASAGAAGDPGAAGADPTAAAGAGGGGGAVDSREDEWARPARTTIGEVDLRILVQDEDAKINVLSLLARDEDQAGDAFDRIQRVIEFFRGESTEEVDRVEAERLTETMRAFLLERRSVEDQLPIPDLLTDDPEDRDRSRLLTLRELVALDPFHSGLFRDYRDDEGLIVHALGSFLTVYSSVVPLSELSPDGGAAPAAAPAAEPGPGDDEDEPDDPDDPAAGGGEAGGDAADGAATTNGARGYAVNINTAPPVVLKALVDDRDVRLRFWDEVIAFRNEEEEPEPDAEDIEPVYDEFGEEIIAHKIFDSLDELNELDGWLDIEPEVRTQVTALLTVESQVFSIFVTARMTGDDSDLGGYGPSSRAEAREQEDRSGAITRTVRSVVWRREGEDGWEIVPIVRWEVLDYAPFEVLDDPDEER